MVYFQADCIDWGKCYLVDFCSYLKYVLKFMLQINLADTLLQATVL